MVDFGTSGFRSLNDLAAELQRLAEEKGFRENIADPRGKAAVAVYVANFHGEASELWEAARCDRLHKPCDKSEQMRAAGLAPMTCLEEELADMIIRPLNIGNVFGVDIDRAVDHEYVSGALDELRMPTGVTIYDVAEYVNRYHSAADMIRSDVDMYQRRLKTANDDIVSIRMPYRAGLMLRIAFHICNVFGLDPISIVMRKHAFNKTRPHRHGGKLV